MADRYKQVMYEFRVQITSNGKTHPPYNYLASDIDDLMEMLWKNDGVDEEYCDELIIHQIMPDGSVCELVNYNKDEGNKRKKAKKKGAVYEFPSGRELVPVKEVDEGELVIGALIDILEDVRKGDTPGEEPKKESKKEEPKGILGGFSYWSYPARSIE